MGGGMLVTCDTDRRSPSWKAGLTCILWDYMMSVCASTLMPGFRPHKQQLTATGAVLVVHVAAIQGDERRARLAA